MTEENYSYRTRQTLLRNQFPGYGKWEIPIIPRFEPHPGDLEPLFTYALFTLRFLQSFLVSLLTSISWTRELSLGICLYRACSNRPFNEWF